MGKMVITLSKFATLDCAVIIKVMEFVTVTLRGFVFHHTLSIIIDCTVLTTVIDSVEIG